MDYLNKAEELITRLDEGEGANSLLQEAMAIMPWQGAPPGNMSDLPGLSNKPIRDEDGFSGGFNGMSEDYIGFQKWQQACWQKFKSNSFVYTTVLDTTGRLTGMGFSQFSHFPKANEFMDKVWHDPRNMLVLNFKKYVARSVIQGELFQCLSLHKDGFVEVDFISPTTITGFSDGSGILTKTGKTNFPLIYRVESVVGGVTTVSLVPSINLAYYPELWKELEEMTEYKNAVGSGAAVIGKESYGIEGYAQFMVHMDQGFVTKRNVGGVKVVMEWLNHYDNMKRWELDHKKSSGAYLWAVEIEDRQAFRLWLSLTEDQRKATGIMGKKTPGGTLMLPPGFKLTCNNPKLASISNQDEDILNMIAGGLNTPKDVMTGSSSGQTYSGAKLSRGPVENRVMDAMSDLERWMIHGFWRGVLWLHHKGGHMKWTYPMKKAYKFANKKPKFQTVAVEAHRTIEMNFPSSEMSDVESKTKAYLGSKHGPVTQTVGISNRTVAKKIGVHGYAQERLDLATEEEMYPELMTNEEAEQTVEGITEPGLPDNKSTTEPNKDSNNQEDD